MRYLGKIGKYFAGSSRQYTRTSLLTCALMAADCFRSRVVTLSKPFNYRSASQDPVLTNTHPTTSRDVPGSIVCRYPPVPTKQEAWYEYDVSEPWFGSG